MVVPGLASVGLAVVLPALGTAPRDAVEAAEVPVEVPVLLLELPVVSVELLELDGSAT